VDEDDLGLAGDDVESRTRGVPDPTSGHHGVRADGLGLVGMILCEQDDEWAVADRRYFSLEPMARLKELGGGEDQKELLAAIA